MSDASMSEAVAAHVFGTDDETYDIPLDEMRKIEGVAVRKFREKLTTQLLKTFPASAERTRFLAQLDFSSELIMTIHGWLKP